MSTVTKIVNRPKDAPKAPIYPRLVTHTESSNGLVVWALGPSHLGSENFAGVVVVQGKSINEVGHYSSGFNVTLFKDFGGAITLYNK